MIYTIHTLFCMDITAPIVAAHSLAGIELGSTIESVLATLYTQNHRIKLSIHDNPGIKLHSYEVDNGIVTVNTDDYGSVVSVSCQPPYQGMYDRKLWPGMSVAQIRAVTQKQLLTCGALVLDGELGVCFALPHPYDEYDYARELPESLIINKMYVMRRNWRGF